MLVGAIIATGYVFANDIEPEEVIFAMGSATEQAQDFVSDVDFEDTGEFPSIVLDDGTSEETVVIARTSSGGFDRLGPTSAVAFGLDTETETDLSVEAPSAIPRPSAQSGTAAIESDASESPETSAAPAPETTVPEVPPVE